MQSLVDSVCARVQNLCGDLKHVEVLEHPSGGVVVLVGTAHVHVKSSNLVSKICEHLVPDRIFLELCKERKGLLERKMTGSSKTAKGMRAFDLKNMLSRGQRMVGRKLDLRVGEEFYVANEIGLKYGKPVHLIDRAASRTVGRMQSSLPPFEKLVFLTRLLFEIAFTSFLSKNSVERIIENHMENGSGFLEVLQQEFQRSYPTLIEILLVERNVWMCSRINTLLKPGEIAVAIVGDGHVKGIKKMLGSASDINPIVETLTVKIGKNYFLRNNGFLYHQNSLYRSPIYSGQFFRIAHMKLKLTSRHATAILPSRQRSWKIYLRFYRSPVCIEKSLDESVSGGIANESVGRGQGGMGGSGGVVDFQEVLQPIGASRASLTFNYNARKSLCRSTVDYTLALTLDSDIFPTKTQPFLLNINFKPPSVFQNICCHMSTHDDETCGFSISLENAAGSPICSNEAEFDAIDYYGRKYNGPRAKPRGKIVVAWLLSFIGMGVYIRNKLSH